VKRTCRAALTGLILTAVIATSALAQVNGDEIQRAVQRGLDCKNESEFFKRFIEPQKLKKQGFVRSTKEAFLLHDSDRISYAVAYRHARLEDVNDDMVRRIPQGMIQVVLKISAWGTQGIANTVRSARDSVLVLRVGGQIVKPVQRAMWVGDFSPGLPIYQINTITSGRSSLTIVNPVGDAFAHGNVFLSSLIRESDVPPGENVELGCWKKGEFQPEFKLERATLENSPSRRNP
jgi:hypothetical protein